MKKPFQVGDLVRVYSCNNSFVDKVTATSGDLLWISGVLYHKKQCRRLMKKKRREWIVVLDKYNRIIRSARQWGPEIVRWHLNEDSSVRVREVKE